MVTCLMQLSSAEKLLSLSRLPEEVPVCERLCADEEDLAVFRANSIDLKWKKGKSWKGIHNVLRPDSAFLGAMWGSESLFELRVALQLADLERLGGIGLHVSPFVSVQDLGSMYLLLTVCPFVMPPSRGEVSLHSSGFRLTTMDVDTFTINYPSIFELLDDLQGMGESNCLWSRRLNLGKEVLMAAAAIYEQRFGVEVENDGQDLAEGEKSNGEKRKAFPPKDFGGTTFIPATFQVLYWIGWKSDESQPKAARRGSGTVSMKDIGQLDLSTGRPKTGQRSFHSCRPVRASHSRPSDHEQERREQERRIWQSLVSRSAGDRASLRLQRDLFNSSRYGRPIPVIRPHDIGVAHSIGLRQTQEDQFVVEWLDINFDVSFNEKGERIKTSASVVHSDTPENAIDWYTKSICDGRDKARRDWMLVAAVFDGHGGGEVSAFLRDHFLPTLIADIEQNPDDLIHTMKRVFHSLDGQLQMHVKELFESNPPRPFPESRRAARDRASHGVMGILGQFRTGSTATVLLLRNGLELVVAQVGDSRALLCRDGQPFELHQMHCCHNPLERARIEGLGGQIFSNSVGEDFVQGRLGMTRSFGDFDLRPFGVTAEPSTRSFGLKHHRDSFLVLTSDGVNRALNDREICVLVSKCESPDDAAFMLADQAQFYSSADNVTALVIPLGAWGQLGVSPGDGGFSLGRTMASSLDRL